MNYFFLKKYVDVDRLLKFKCIETSTCIETVMRGVLIDKIKLELTLEKTFWGLAFKIGCGTTKTDVTAIRV